MARDGTTKISPVSTTTTSRVRGNRCAAQPSGTATVNASAMAGSAMARCVPASDRMRPVLAASHVQFIAARP